MTGSKVQPPYAGRHLEAHSLKRSLAASRRPRPVNGPMRPVRPQFDRPNRTAEPKAAIEPVQHRTVWSGSRFQPFDISTSSPRATSPATGIALESHASGVVPRRDSRWPTGVRPVSG